MLGKRPTEVGLSFRDLLEGLSLDRKYRCLCFLDEQHANHESSCGNNDPGYQSPLYMLPV